MVLGAFVLVVVLTLVGYTVTGAVLLAAAQAFGLVADWTWVQAMLLGAVFGIVTGAIRGVIKVSRG